MSKKPTAPAHLRPPTKRWFSHVVGLYALEEHHVKLLTLAAESWDRCQEAREILQKSGLTYLDRFQQPRARPEVAIERDSRLAFARLLRELALDVIEPGTENRPPIIAGKNHRRIA